jgi:plasmid replication initiation protein
MERVEKQEAVVKAMEGENKEEIQKAREDLKGTHEMLVEKAKAFNADVKAIREHLGIQMGSPKRGEGTPAPKE